MEQVRRWVACALLAVLAACGGGDGQISVTISGLTSSGMVLYNGTDTISVASGATSATFPTLLVDGATYNVVVQTQPDGLFCTVTNGSGTVSSSTPSADITVSCSASYLLSGTVSNLTGSGLVIYDGVENLSVPAGQTSFAFPTRLDNGDTYSMQVITNPSGQKCTFSGNVSGTVDGAPINVTLGCSAS